MWDDSRVSFRASQRGTRRFASGVLATGLALLAATSPAIAAPRPDLKVTEVVSASTSVMAGSELAIEDTTSNAGARRAPRSTTRFYASRDDERSGGDTRLKGKRAIGRLAPSEGSEGDSALTVPLTAPQGDVYILACADDKKRIEEKREGNNCRASEAPLTIELPVLCTDQLTALGIEFDPGPSAQGVADPVTVTTPINGITYSGQTGNDIFMDCTLAVALHAMGDEMDARGLTHVEHAGVYNYRCIGGGIPPCGNGQLSRHAYADAIDILELRSDSGETFNVNDDWMIDSEAEETCAAPTDGDKDALLHEFACAVHASGTFHIVLTPNYNAAHRNHFHLDLTPDFSFIE